MDAITKVDLELKKFSSGKVRETFELENGNLLMVATDRLSAFDVVFEQGIPHKGEVLNLLSEFWFKKTAHIVKNHMVSIQVPEGLPKWLEKRSMEVKKCTPLKLECVVRGYLAGSGWKEYQKSGKVCGIELPKGLELASKLPEPIFTPSTKAEVGHDMNITAQQGREIIGDIYDDVERISLELYSYAAEYAFECGIILADTKFEFGVDGNGELMLIDEALTPDSSRYWPSGEYEVGKSPPSYDKQYVRDFVEKTGWDKKPPAPKLPDEVIKGTTDRYIEAYEKLAKKKFER